MWGQLRVGKGQMKMPNNETLGPAERIVQTLLNFSGHMVHNRPGLIVDDPANPAGVRWAFCTHKVEDDKKVVYLVTKGKKPNTKVGTLWADGTVRTEDRRKVGRYQKPGIVPEIALWMYRQVAEVWQLDNEFAAKWASYAYPQDNKDLKVILAAFMLVQSRKGDPIVENGEVLFWDDDYRAVGEAMVLLTRKDKRHLDAKLVKRVYDVLCLPEIAALNRELGFGRSARKRALGRWSATVRRWLQFREQNFPMLEGLVKSGNKEVVKKLSKCAGYKPQSPKFYEVLGWSQKQAEDGRRNLAVGEQFTTAESWEGMTEEQVCEKIVTERIGFKRLTSLLPKGMGLTRAVVAASIEVGWSNKDFVIYAPLLEELGLLKVQDIRERWEAALKSAEDQRAANVARNLKSKEARDKHEEAADVAVQEAVKEAVKAIRPIILVDISSSMALAIEAAKGIIERFLPGFPLDKITVIVFNTAARALDVKHQSRAGVQQAFRGIVAGGGTSYAVGVKEAARVVRPGPDEDVLMLFIGDEEDFGGANPLTQAVQASGLNPMAFGLIRLRNSAITVVQDAAANLQIPCFRADEAVFDDPYAVPRTIRALVAATPVGQRVGGAPAPVRVSLVDQILQTELLKRPVWAESEWVTPKPKAALDRVAATDIM
jgi:Mg-chelatase subunit ChlD